MRTVGILLAALFCVAAVYVRVWGLSENPLWYTDETNYIGLAEDLGSGTGLTEARHKAIVFPFATNAVPHPPLYFVVNGALIRLFGASVLTGRALSAALGLVCMALLYQATRLLWGRMAGVLAAGLFAFHLPSVFFLRWGMPYNLAMAFQIAAFWALAHGERGRHRDWLNFGAVALAGLAAASAFFGLFALVFVCGMAGWRLRRRWGVLAGALALGWGPFVIFVLIGLGARGGAFWEDFAALGMRASGGDGLFETLEAFGWQLWWFVSRDVVYLAGFSGLIAAAVLRRERRWPLVYFAMLAVPILLKRGGDPEIKYDAVEYLFLVCVGAGAGAALLRGWAVWIWGRKRAIEMAAMGLVSVWIVLLGGMRIWQVSTALPSRYEALGSVLSANDAKSMADWINERVGAEDFVIAPERVDFLLQCRATSPYQSVAYVTGSTTWHENLTPDRFAFPCDYRKARFIVIDHTDRTIVLDPANPNMEFLVMELYSGRWGVVEEIGEYRVFERAGGE